MLYYFKRRKGSYNINKKGSKGTKSWEKENASDNYEQILKDNLNNDYASCKEIEDLPQGYKLRDRSQ